MENLKYKIYLGGAGDSTYWIKHYIKDITSWGDDEFDFDYRITTKENEALEVDEDDVDNITCELKKLKQYYELEAV